MTRYDTPIEVAYALTKHAPKNLRSILDPCVGTGRLLEPLKERLSLTAERIVCIDNDKDVICELQPKFNFFGKRLKLVCSDFLHWSDSLMGLPKMELFDCIVMNPPFAARKKDYIKLSTLQNINLLTKDKIAIPVEAAFLLQSIQLLKPKGRLLAVIPSSITSSLSTQWLRELLLKLGAVHYIHELPRFTFKEVDSRIYLFIFEKMGKERNIILRNHDLSRPENLKFLPHDLSPDFRFDFSYHRARKWHSALKINGNNSDWKPLGSLLSIYRGTVQSPIIKGSAIHTCDYHNGFWSVTSHTNIFRKMNAEHLLKKGDLLIKRVGRNCVRSIGKVKEYGYPCSDCIFILRPKTLELTTKILFAFRVLMTSSLGPGLLERGTGATYITESGLLNLLIPFDLSKYYPKEFAKYEQAIAQRNFETMLIIEQEVLNSFQRLTKLEGSNGKN